MGETSCERTIFPGLQLPRSRPPLHRRSSRPSVVRRWCDRGGLSCADLDPASTQRTPAAWNEVLLWAASGTNRELTSKEAHKFRRIDQPVAATFTATDGPGFGCMWDSAM